MNEVTDKESSQTLAKLKKIANEWKTKLEDPVIQGMVKSGRIVISPLVKELMEMFPDGEKPSPRKVNGKTVKAIKK